MLYSNRHSFKTEKPESESIAFIFRKFERKLSKYPFSLKYTKHLVEFFFNFEENMQINSGNIIFNVKLIDCSSDSFFIAQFQLTKKCLSKSKTLENLYTSSSTRYLFSMF